MVYIGSRPSPSGDDGCRASSAPGGDVSRNGSGSPAGARAGSSCWGGKSSPGAGSLAGYSLGWDFPFVGPWSCTCG